MSFGYDVYGNLSSKTSNVSGDLNVTGTTYGVTGRPHRLVAATIAEVANTLTYDSNGSITPATRRSRHATSQTNSTPVSVSLRSRAIPSTIHQQVVYAAYPRRCSVRSGPRMNQEQLVAALTQRLVDLVEPNTRFGRTSIPVANGEIHLCQITGTQTYSVSFGASENSGRGALDAGVRRLEDKSDLERYVARQTAANEAGLAERLRTWLRTQPELPGDALTSAACYGGSETAGYQYQCQPCSGRGKTKCSPCNGSGQTTCSRCRGTGRVDCSTCNGRGETSCTGCGGSGQVGQHRERRVTNHAANTSHTESYIEYQTCSSCFGSRIKKCSCSGGEVSCGCLSGKVTCNDCFGSGEAKCKNCDATGILNGTATLTCSVSEALSLQVDVDAKEPKSTIESIATLRKLCALTRVESTANSVSSVGLARKLAAKMWFTAVDVEAAGATHTVFGYGDKAVVFDFKNIVGALLKNDLEALESALTETPRVPLGPVKTLDDALATFLQSEINARIGEVLNGNAAALEKFASGELKGAVSADYVVRAAAAVRSSVTRIYGSELARPAMILALSVASFVVLSPLVNFAHPTEALGLALVVAPFGGAYCEYRGRSRLKARFSAGLAPRAIALLQGTWALWLWRGVMLGGVVMAAFAMNYVVAWLRLAFA